MSPGKRLMYLTILEDDLNYKLEQKLKKADKLIVSGSEKGISWIKKKGSGYQSKQARGKLPFLSCCLIILPESLGKINACYIRGS